MQVPVASIPKMREVQEGYFDVFRIFDASVSLLELNRMALKHRQINASVNRPLLKSACFHALFTASVI